MRRRPARSGFLFLSILLLGAYSVPNPCLARTLHVSPNGSGTDGLSWETAFTTVHAAMPAASSGDHVWVRSAIYTGTIQMTTGVSLFGGFAGTETLEEFHLRDWSGNPTILNGGGPIIKLANNTTVDGFTIRNDLSSGGGILAQSTTGQVKNCLISRNRVSGIRCFDSMLSILNCEVSENEGGGIVCQDSDVIIEGCIIADNTNRINSFGGGLFVTDGGTHVYMTRSYVIRNRAESNTGAAGGGGIYSSGARLILDRCVIARNVAKGTSPLGPHSDGGAIFSAGGVEATLTNCLIDGNEAVGGKVFTIVQDSVFKLESCTITSDEHISISGANNLSMVNSIFYANGRAVIFGQAFISFSNVKGGAPGVGNIDADPLFVDPANGDFRLQPGSPCIDSASMNGPSIDLDGNPRPIDVLGAPPEGPGAFDMGAYEFQLPEGDLNSNGLHDPFDLFLFQREWMKANEIVTPGK